MAKKIRVKSPIGVRLREVREEKGISQKQLGILACIDQFAASARINQYEQDKHAPDFTTATRLAEVLSIPVTYFYADDDEMAEFILLFASASKRKRAEVKRLLSGKVKK